MESVDNILYVKSINSVWKLDAEIALQSFRERCESLLEIQSKGSAWSYLSNLTLSKYNLDCQSPDVSKFIEAQSPWRIILSNSQEKLAVLQDSHIEIRSADNEFTEVLHKWALPSRDLFPQWRNLAWSPCDSLLAFSDSQGNVFLYSINGDQLSHVFQPKHQSCDLGNAVCSLIFKDRRSFNHQVDDHQHWLHELLVLNYQGTLNAFIISQEGDHRLLHTFNFDGGYPNGVTDAAYISTSSLLLVGGGTFWKNGVPVANGEAEMLRHGVSAWRILSDHPHYKLVSDYEFESKTAGLKTFSSSKCWWPWSADQIGDKVVKMAVSPDRKMLISVHSSENICIWSLPSMRLFKKFSLDEQPDRDYIDPDVLENPKKKRTYKDILNAFYIVSLAWWSKKDIIISRGTGSLTVSNVSNLINRLGSSPEFFQPETSLMRFSDGCFYVLECQKRQGSKRDVELSEKEEEMVSDVASVESDEDTFEGQTGGLITKLIRQSLYYITDSDAFQPPKKRSRLMRRVYRMMCLKSTTPEELYSNMLDGEEYGEALLLARKYNLDCDLTYQRQWKESSVTVSSIQDYLRKITKRSWVLHECLETVPADLDAMEELLKYGLQGTDLEAVVAAGRDDDDGKFIFCESTDDYKPMEHDESGMNEEERRRELLKQISFHDLTLNQKELCRIRLKLLQYLDKLETYQDILGGRHLAFEKYDKVFFKKFRKENIVQLAVEFAQLSDVSALESLFRYHGHEVLPHRLAVLCNIPETTSPDVFSRLLPKICVQGDRRVVEEWEESRWRSENDWSEQFCSSLSAASTDNPGEFLYKEDPDLMEFRGRKLSEEQLTSWFKKRSLEIEKMSGQVDCASALLQYGIQNNVQGLETLQEDFTLMEMLVYECHASPGFNFDSLLKMSTMERIRQMMAKTTREMFIKNLRKWVLPFLKQQELKVTGSYFSLLRQYMLEMAAEDLTYVELIFKENRLDKTDAIIRDVQQLFSISSECLYAHSSHDQLCLIKSIIDSLPDPKDDSKECHMRKSMSNHHLGAEILKKNGIEQTLAQIRDIQNSDLDAIKILTRLARVSAKKTPPMSQSELKQLLMDMCELQENVFSNISRDETCEIFVGALLCSGNVSHINLGGKVMDSSYNLPSSNLTSKNPPSKMSVRSSLKDSFKSLTGTTRASSPPSLNLSAGFIDCTIDRSKFVELVLQAAREYFNSSPDFLHENMKLARCCLELIKDRPPEVQEELNLIEALAMLKFHGISEFPAHLRIAEDRLKYVKDVLKKKTMMYKNYSKLLELGKLLNIGKGDEEVLQGKIFDLIAQQALEAKDYPICLDSCTKLMTLNYEDGWSVCKSLAEDEGFQDDSSKFSLFNFVLLHAPDCQIQGVLESLSELQVKTLCHEVTKSMNSVEPPVQASSENEGSMKSIENVLIGQTKQVFNLTRAAFDHMGDSHWWSGVVNNAATGLKRFTAPGTKNKRRRMNKSLRSGSIDKELGNYFTKQTFHPFYDSLHHHQSSSGIIEENDYLDVYVAHETRDGTSDSLVDINELLLRIYLLNKCADDGKSSHLLTQVLLVLAENVLPRDTSLGLSYLLALPDAFSAEKCFDRLPKTPLCYQLAMYFFSLKIALEMKTFGKPLPSDFYSVPPRELVRQVEMQADELDPSSEQKKMLERMFYYGSLLLDYQESETLKNMGRGIDTTRFVSDESYKKETILGMALTLDDEVLSAALKLASKYELLTRDVYMAHLSFLFEDSSGLTTEQIERRIKDLKMLKVLNENPTWFSQTLQEQIFPLIEGSDLDRLLVYYSCLVPENQIDEGGKLELSQKKDAMEAKEASDDIKPLMHIKMLTKFKNVAPGINYKDLLSGRCDIKNVLGPILDANNVAVFAKYSANFVDKSGRIISPSFVHKCFASKNFNAPSFENEQVDWVARYKDCLESIHALAPDVLVEFIDENLFGTCAIKKIPVESRKQILKGLMKHSKQQLSLSRKSNQQRNSDNWDEAVKILQMDLDHLNRMSTKIIFKLSTSDNFAWQQYAHDFDLTQSRIDEVKNLFKRIILQLESVEFIEEIVKNLSSQELACQDLYVEVLKELCSTSNLPDSDDSLGKVKCILNEISRHPSRGGSVINVNEVCAYLKNFVSSSDVEPHFKLQIFSVIKESSPLKDDDIDILYSQTCAILSMLDHHDIQLTPERISQESERILIFKRLLEGLTSLDELNTLIHLLNNWPSTGKSENLWCELLRKMITSTSQGEVSHQVLQHIQESIAKGHLNEKEIEDLADLVAAKDSLSFCKILLTSSNKELINRALSALKSKPSDLKDEGLFILFLNYHLLPQCTNLPFYSNILDFMMTHNLASSSITSQTICPSKGMVPAALKDLSLSGKKVEAGTFFMSWRSVHRTLRTFDAAMNFADKFLSK